MNVISVTVENSDGKQFVLSRATTRPTMSNTLGIPDVINFFGKENNSRIKLGMFIVTNVYSTANIVFAKIEGRVANTDEVKEMIGVIEFLLTPVPLSSPTPFVKQDSKGEGGSNS